MTSHPAARAQEATPASPVTTTGSAPEAATAFRVSAAIALPSSDRVAASTAGASRRLATPNGLMGTPTNAGIMARSGRWGTWAGSLPAGLSGPSSRGCVADCYRRRAMRPGPISYLLIPVVLATVLVGGCGGADVTVDETDNGSSIDLEVGQTLEVSLEENPSTGFAWNVTEEPDAAVIAPVEDDFDISDPYSDGAGGTRSLLFEAVAPGETEMLLDYYFQTESDDVYETFSLTVTVAP